MAGASLPVMFHFGSWLRRCRLDGQRGSGWTVAGVEEGAPCRMPSLVAGKAWLYRIEPWPQRPTTNF